MKILIITNQYPSTDNPVTNPAVFNQAEQIRRFGIDVDILRVETIQRGYSQYLRLALSLPKKWREGDYELLHVHFGGIQALISALVAKKKTIITYHGTDLHGGSPGTIFSWVKSKLNTWSSREAARLAGKLIVVSSNLLSYLPANQAKKATIITTGVDYRQFRPQSKITARKELGLKKSSRYVLFSAISNSPIKRFDIAMKVEELVRKEFPEAELLRLAEQPYSRVPLYLNASDCLLLTSDKEGSPNIIKEALAVNLPIVSVDVGDVQQRCKGVPNCQVVSRNIENLSQAVIQAFGMERSMGGRVSKRDEIDNILICQRIVRLYKAVLDQDSDRKMVLGNRIP